MSAECITHGCDLLYQDGTADYCPMCDLALVKHDLEELLQAASLWLSETGPGMHVNTAKGRGETRRVVERLRGSR